MRFNVIALAWALAAPAMGAGVIVGQNGFLQEVETTPVATPSAAVSGPVVPAANSGKVQAHSSAANTVPAGGAKVTPTSAAAISSAAPLPGASVAASIPAVGAKSSSVPAAGGKVSSTPAAGGNKPTPTPTPAPSTGGNTGGSAPKSSTDKQFVIIKNQYGAHLDLGLINGQGSATLPKTALNNGESATLTVASGWGGRVAVNPTGAPKGSQEGTKIEGAFNRDSPGGFWDISLVDGYTVPITCTCEEKGTTPFIGCNVELYKQAKKCPSPSGDALCLNPARGRNKGPEDPWFSACLNASYLFPQNDIATQKCDGTMTCCVGTSCAANPNQPANKAVRRWAFPRGSY